MKKSRFSEPQIIGISDIGQKCEFMGLKKQTFDGLKPSLSGVCQIADIVEAESDRPKWPRSGLS